jgi:hypothetical protein
MATAAPPPPSIEPIYETRKPNAPIRLARGKLILRDAAREAAGTGRVEMVLGSNTRIEFSFPNARPPIPPEAWSDDARLIVPALTASSRMLLSNVGTQWTAATRRLRTTYSGIVRGSLAFGTGPGLERAVVHVLNFPSYVGDHVARPGGGSSAARTVLVGGGWHVTMDEVAGTRTLIPLLRATGGHGITHVLEIRRDDGSAFDATDLDEPISVLGYLLSFARGAWTFPHLVAAFGAGSTPQWQEWADLRLDPWVSRMAWWEHVHPEPLGEVFAGMWPIWRDPQKQSVLRVAIGWLVEAGSSVSVESRIVLAQAALELLAWQRLVNEGTWTAAKFKTSAASKIRGLLDACGIPAALPGSLAGAASAAILHSPTDGPDFTVRVRNRSAHPPKSGPHAFVPSNAVVAAWRLAVQYHQLALLNWLGYRGSVVSPVDLATRRVPWA